MLSTPLPHWLHHCPPPTYSPHPNSAELCVRHISPVCPGLQGWRAKKLQGETHNQVLSTSFFMVLSTKGCLLHLLLWPQSLTCCLLPAPLLLLPPQPMQSTPRHLPKVKVMARLFFFFKIFAFEPCNSTFTVGQIIIIPQLRNTRTWMQVSFPQTFLPFWNRLWVQCAPVNRATCKTQNFPVRFWLWKQSLNY